MEVSHDGRSRSYRSDLLDLVAGTEAPRVRRSGGAFYETLERRENQGPAVRDDLVVCRD